MGVLVIPSINESCKDAFSCHNIDEHSVHADPFQRKKQVLYTPDINLSRDDIKFYIKKKREIKDP